MQQRVRVQEGLQLVLHVSFHIATPPGLEKGLRISNIERSKLGKTPTRSTRISKSLKLWKRASRQLARHQIFQMERRFTEQKIIKIQVLKSHQVALKQFQSQGF